MKNAVLILFALIVLGGAWLLLRKPTSVTQVYTTPVNTNINPAPTTIDPSLVTDGSIVIDLPLANATGTSPIAVSGRARGNWFFEASAPVTVIDSNGKTIGQAQIRATGDWMTTEYVPFTGSVSYTLGTSTTTSGYLLFMNDNPSGDPTRSVSVRVPIKFKR
ncbi:hypothetical protein BH11PAT3_BH11PAT3_2700 [soil metagenome]